MCKCKSFVITKMATQLNNGMCRCCASEGTFKDVKNTYQWMGEEEIYSEMLRECFDIAVSILLDNPKPNKKSAFCWEVKLPIYNINHYYWCGRSALRSNYGRHDSDSTRHAMDFFVSNEVGMPAHHLGIFRLNALHYLIILFKSHAQNASSEIIFWKWVITRCYHAWLAQPADQN